jgi:phosphatidylserine decarboxylase
MSDAAQPDPLSFESFNAFFTRALRADARPLDPDPAALVSPVDGSVSQLGRLDGSWLVQAKGHAYTLESLLAADAAWAETFRGGVFATLYLAPFNYHRIHMPRAGALRAAWYVPGQLFSVNATTAASVPGLFARNERVVCVFDSAEHGPFVMVLVGATIVGSMATVWHGVVNPPRMQKVTEWSYADKEVVLRKGEEMGRFLLGSTVVMLFKQGTIGFNPEWAPERSVRLGEVMGVTP